MSGVAGIYHLNGCPVNLIELGRMTDILVHRGPDVAALWQDGIIGLGHRMLWTTPESLTEKLPLVDTSCNFVITADARIDNRDELIPLVGLSDRPFSEITDSEIILAAYKVWNTDCPLHLLGDFAFAIWDKREQMLFCARDPMGVKPFYYVYQQEVAFWFASEIKALVSLPAIPKCVNEEHIADLLALVFLDKEATAFKRVLRLLPAHCLLVNSTGVKSWEYWALDPERELDLKSDDEYLDAFQEIFFEAVRCRLRSAFPIGSTFSGGLDSSAIACVTDRLLMATNREPLHTFSAGFPSLVSSYPTIDDRPYIEAVLSTGNFNAHYVPVDRSRILDDVSWHEDEILAAPNLYMYTPLFKAAQEQGVRVLLSGFEGDATISYGYEYLDELARNGDWVAFAQEADTLAGRQPEIKALSSLKRRLPYLTELLYKGRWLDFIKQTGEIADHFPLTRQQIVMTTAVYPLVWKPTGQRWRQLRGARETKLRLPNLNLALNSAFAERVGLTERIQSYNRQKFDPVAPLRKTQALSLSDGFLHYVSEIFDQRTARFGLEQRYPFFDRRLMEFCLALPLKQKLWQGWTRAILRRSMQNILPPLVQWRADKGNIGANLRCRLFDEQVRINDLFAKNGEIINEYIDTPTLQAAYQRFLAQPLASTDADMFTVYLVTHTVLWLKQINQVVI